MVKKKPGRKKAQCPNDYTTEISKFIDPTIEYSKEKICLISKPKKYEPSEAENFSLPSRHHYQSIIDFTAKKSSEHIEDPLTTQEIEEGTKLAREIVDKFALSGPEYELSKEELSQLMKSKVTLGHALKTINESSFREEFIKFLGKYQTTNINDRQTKRGSNSSIISKNCRIKIIKQYLKDKKSRDICKNLYGRISVRLIDEFIEFYNLNGEKAITMDFKPKKSHRLTEEQCKFLCDLTEDPNNIGLSLKERKHILCNHFGIKAKTDDIREVLKENGYSMKRLRSVVPEADNIPHKNARCRVAQQLIYFLHSGKELISVDETQVTRGDNQVYGWSKIGIRATQVAQKKGRPLHIIAAISKDKVIGYMIRYVRIEKHSYKHFLYCLFEKLREMDPANYKERFFVLMDNAGAHKHKVVKDFLESQDITVMCNAPMTPQLQPIEFVFSIFKHNLRKVQLFDEEELFWAVYQSFRKITPRQLHNTYLHTMRAYESGLKYADFQHNCNPYVTDGKIRRSGKLLSHMINFEKLMDKDWKKVQEGVLTE
ncbi:unnamed protein product [Blepharisma stoltei]|uniref:Tc1-like transposase DDE domain-containing protein n=1 Tax=Blepharisma stoltei TaxID=1481888 RepID=A0AAU9K2I8_9CILI|nr:unnamed protein product [Blepharisma stoltei]